METELKYSIPDEITAAKLWEDEMLMQKEEQESREKVTMKAVYFDTEDFVLSKNDIAFRIRQEGSKIVATLKWGGKAEGALHQRQELNVPVSDPAAFIMPSADIFKESDIGEELIAILEDKPLSGIVDMNFVRSKFRVDLGESLVEVSVDKGEIAAESGKEPILEAELELFSGEEEQLLSLGETLKEKYGLTACEKSKFARGLALIGVAGENR